ncbi:putative Ig domain-containing protein [uncultured Paraglaciecola sp.]|uniref:putative Ig domain-containing protein n=1 Tax=uncultured Paraglaciecola sp. TaxID=1765024 RepID=UPI0025D794B6|nr:putative Ig domain-containing protein [uncultured Paraglaciecola sp.]
MADLLGRVHCKQFYLLILMTLFISSCGDDNDDTIQPIPVANSAPAISSADTDTASIGTLFNYTLTATDADGDTLTYQASLLPAWLTFDAAIAELSGTPPAGSAGDYQVTLAASDGMNSTPVFLTISIANSAPVITSTAGNNGVIGSAYSYTLTANDADADTLIYSSVTLPTWAAFDAASGVLTGTPTTAGDSEVELSVSDGEASVNQKFTLVVTNTPSVVISFDQAVVFSDFGGTVTDVIANPDQTGINTSDEVGRMQKFAGEVFGGTTISLNDPLTLAAKLLFGQEISSQFLSAKSIAASNVFTLKVWSQRQVALTFKLEGDVDANDVERVVTHDGTGWEVLSFDFTDVTGTGYTAITLIFDNGVVGDAADDAANWTFYFDDMVIPVAADDTTGGDTAASIVNGLENALDSYTFGNFEGGAASVIANPDASGINTSAQVGQMVKSAGATYGGSTLTLDSAVDIPADAIITMKVWSQRAVDVLFKLEGGPVGEVTTAHSGSGWEELSFDFTGISGEGTTGVTLIFDNGTAGDAENDAVNWTFYFDDLTFPVAADDTTGGDTAASIVNGLENALDSYTFGNFEGGAASVIANPDASGINTSAQVGQMVKSAGATYGGSTLTLDSAVDIPADAIITMKVWSQRAVDVLFKLEGGPVGEVTTAHSGSGWEELSFDFTGISGAGTTGVTLIFDNGTAGDAENDAVNWTFYFDDLTFPVAADAGTGGGADGTELTVNGNFEAGDLSNWIATANGGTITAENTAVTDNSWAAYLVAGPTNAPALSQVGLAAGSVNVGDTIDISFDMCGTAADGGVIFPALLSEFGGDTGADRELLATIASPPSVWTRYYYSTVAGGPNANVTGGVSLQFDVVCGGDATCSAAAYFDNVSVTIGGGPVAGTASGNSCIAGGGSSTNDSPIDFEGAADTYAFTDFDGGEVTIVANPGVAGNDSVQVGKMLKNAGQPWGGSTLALNSPIDLADGDVFTLQVWSDRVVNVLFKLEGTPNQERDMNHGGTGWETLSFDFTGSTSTGVNGVTLIFDNGTMGAGGDDWTFYFDNMTLPDTSTGGGDTGGSSGSGLSAIDFESGGAGASYAWAVFENSDNPALEIIANPDMSGANTSATVAKFTARVDGQAYAGVESAHGDFGPLTLDATNSTVKIMVWKSVVSDIGIKFAIANGGAKAEIKVSNTQINQWEEITFDLSANIGAAESINIDQIIIFPDFNVRAAETVTYFDNITFGN